MRRRNPDPPQLPAKKRYFLPAEEPGKAFVAVPIPAAQHAPPRGLSLESLVRGELPLVYLPHGAYENEAVSEALYGLLRAHPAVGLSSPDAWDRLLAAVGHRAKVYVVDGRGERWLVADVFFDRGGETGELLVEHLGPEGKRRVPLLGSYGAERGYAHPWLIPVVVYKAPPPRPEAL